MDHLTCCAFALLLPTTLAGCRSAEVVKSEKAEARQQQTNTNGFPAVIRWSSTFEADSIPVNTTKGEGNVVVETVLSQNLPDSIRGLAESLPDLSIAVIRMIPITPSITVDLSVVEARWDGSLISCAIDLSNGPQYVAIAIGNSRLESKAAISRIAFYQLRPTEGRLLGSRLIPLPDQGFEESYSPSGFIEDNWRGYLGGTSPTVAPLCWSLNGAASNYIARQAYLDEPEGLWGGLVVLRDYVKNSPLSEWKYPVFVLLASVR
jgi:hypothetical protein